VATRRDGDVVGDDMVFATVREAVETLTAVPHPAGARDAPGSGPRLAHPIRTMRADRPDGTIA
jgi:hypothetical protein